MPSDINHHINISPRKKERRPITEITLSTDISIIILLFTFGVRGDYDTVKSELQTCLLKGEIFAGRPGSVRV